MSVRVKMIDVSLFSHWVTVVIADTIEEARDYINESFDPCPDLEPEFFCNANGMHTERLINGKYYDIILFSGDAELRTVIHECFHCVMKMCNTRGCAWCPESDEFYAYLMDSFTDEVIKFYQGRE